MSNFDENIMLSNVDVFEQIWNIKDSKAGFTQLHGNLDKLDLICPFQIWKTFDICLKTT